MPYFLNRWLEDNPENAPFGLARAKVVEPDPKWWADFLDERYPGAPKRTYGQIAARLPDLIAEGHRWATSCGSSSRRI